MKLSPPLALMLLTLTSAGCSAPSARPSVATPLPTHDSLYEPDRVQPGRLEYAPDRMTFAPVLTERFAYPTQAQANEAFRRMLGNPSSTTTAGPSIWLFGCSPGALDSQTARIDVYRAPVVHCATDFLDSSGRRRGRETANFYYHSAIWNMQLVNPPQTPVAWSRRESSPRDPWRWVPGRDRYE